MRELQQGATSCKPAVSLWGKFEIGDLVRGGGFMWERVKWGRWFTMVPGKRRLRLYVVGDGPDIWWLMVRAKAKADAPRRDKHGFATVHRERCPSSEDVFRRAREVVNLLVHGRRPNARPLDTVRRKGDTLSVRTDLCGLVVPGSRALCMRALGHVGQCAQEAGRP